jgi:signal peptidase II
MAMSRRYKLFLIVAAIAFAADQITKIWARAALEYGAPATKVIENFFELRLSFNTGAAFGLLSGTTGARVLLTLVGVIACGVIVLLLRKARDDQPWTTWAFGLVAGGALGNVVDRALFGKVTDFIVWRWYEREWPTFNIADAALVAGVLILLLDVGKEQKREKLRQEQEKGARPAKGAART